mmetsp:Transcript_56879/g.99430  ORF Transcript_56879/g.99430 Transcript_56879/m.99430 type:complete len:363 (+) Transcript_56879:120-1208(+)
MVVSHGASCSKDGCQIIEDVKLGWEDYCIGLNLLNDSCTEEQCRKHCCADPDCEVWQWGVARQERKTDSRLLTCYTGRGFECASDRLDNFLVFAGQRISHGTVQKQIKLTDGVWCTGTGMRHTSYSTHWTHKKRLDSCREACFDRLDCRVWQYSTVKGCWFGSPTQCLEDVSLRGTIMDAERVERHCNSAVFVRTNYTVVLAMLMTAAALLLCLATFILTCGLCGSKRRARNYRREDSISDNEEVYDDDNSSRGDYNASSPGSKRGPYSVLNTASSFNSSTARSRAPSTPGSVAPSTTPGTPAPGSASGSFATLGLADPTNLPGLGILPGPLPELPPTSLSAVSPLPDVNLMATLQPASLRP